MKKTYVTPIVEKVEFNYNETVVASSGNCRKVWINTGDDNCSDGNKFQDWAGNVV